MYAVPPLPSPPSHPSEKKRGRKKGKREGGGKFRRGASPPNGKQNGPSSGLPSGNYYRAKFADATLRGGSEPAGGCGAKGAGLGKITAVKGRARTVHFRYFRRHFRHSLAILRPLACPRPRGHRARARARGTPGRGGRAGRLPRASRDRETSGVSPNRGGNLRISGSRAPLGRSRVGHRFASGLTTLPPSRGDRRTRHGSDQRMTFLRDRAPSFPRADLFSRAARRIEARGGREKAHRRGET